MDRLVVALVALMAALSAAPAMADAPAPVGPSVTGWSQGAAIEEVTVSAHIPGPPLWKVTSANGELWILGIVYPVPKNFEWEHQRVKSLLDGARAVYMPPAVEIGMFDAAWFLLTKMHTLKQPDGRTLDDTLTPELRTRLADWRKKIGKDDDTGYIGAAAAVDFELAFHRKVKLNGKTLDTEIGDLASDAGVPAKRIAKYAGMPVLKELTRLPADGQTVCLKDALDDMDAQDAHARAAARAWADGDLAGIKAHYSEAKLFDCFDQSKTAAGWRAALIDQSYRAAKEALSVKGRSLMVLNMGAVLRRGGVLDRLKADGYTVTEPKE